MTRILTNPLGGRTLFVFEMPSVMESFARLHRRGATISITSSGTHLMRLAAVSILNWSMATQPPPSPGLPSAVFLSLASAPAGLLALRAKEQNWSVPGVCPSFVLYWFPCWRIKLLAIGYGVNSPRSWPGFVQMPDSLPWRSFRLCPLPLSRAGRRR